MRTDRISYLIRGLTGLALIGATALVIALNPFVLGWIGGYQANARLQSQGVHEAREAGFRTLCGTYYQATLIERWTDSRFWDRGWCSDYKHRL